MYKYVKSIIAIVCVFVLSSMCEYTNQLSAQIHSSQFHPGVYQSLYGCSEGEKVMQLSDASKWVVLPEERGILRALPIWSSSDVLFIKPKYNGSWCSCWSYDADYKYVIYNQNLNSAISVRFLSPPASVSERTFHVAQIDRYSKSVMLTDNSVWQIDLLDQDFSRWQVSDRIIIGLNNRWREVSHPYILINAELNNHPYSTARLTNYPSYCP